MPRFAVRRLDEIPTVGDAAVEWYPLQHYFGLTAFGVNAFVARAAGDELVAEHDESGSGQEELYIVLRGGVRFTLDDESHDMAAVSVVAVPDPSVRRSAVALDEDATLLATGAEAHEAFASTWRSSWFDHVPRA